MGPIGVFDSGYGGLTVLREIRKILPEHDFVYFGDNARTPYGTRSYETIYSFTLDAVKKLFEMGCPLVILACNTASAKALRTIQQEYLPTLPGNKRILGVIRPTTEMVGNISKTKHIGVFGTRGTIQSDSYPIEIKRFFPDANVYQVACPMWVPLIENNEHLGHGADFFVKKYITQLQEESKKIDTIILGCTHYPLIISKIQSYLPKEIAVLDQGEIVANSLNNYLTRHPEMNSRCTKNKTLRFYTTDDPITFNNQASIFFDSTVKSVKTEIPAR